MMVSDLLSTVNLEKIDTLPSEQEQQIKQEMKQNIDPSFSENGRSHNVSDNRNRNWLHNRNNECYVDTDVFNQLLKCCSDPSHLNSSYIDGTVGRPSESVILKKENSSPMDIRSLDSNITDVRLTPNVKDMKSSTLDSSSVKTSDIGENCTPIDLNPRCVEGCLHSLDRVQHDHSEYAPDVEKIIPEETQRACSHTHTQEPAAAALSEMVMLNNFFSACCEDTDQGDGNEDFKYPLISPALTGATNVILESSSFPRPVASTKNVSKLRESLKIDPKQQGDHHHHLLHLHHHNPDDPAKIHTHDLIFHHHNAHNCENHIANHHHHLHFQDQVDGQIIKHDFILPDCDVPTIDLAANSANDFSGINATMNSTPTIKEETNTGQSIKQDECTDFLTSSICNLDSIYNDPEFNNFMAPECCDHKISQPQAIDGYVAAKDEGNDTCDVGIPECQTNTDNEHIHSGRYCRLNLKLPSQKCQNKDCTSPTCNGVIPHHHLHHHNHSHQPRTHAHSHKLMNPRSYQQQCESSAGNIKSIHDEHFHSRPPAHSKLSPDQLGRYNQIVITNIQHTDENGQICTHIHPHAHAHSNSNSHAPTPERNNSLSEAESRSDLMLCKWKSCDEEIDMDDIEKHIFQHHLQHLPLSPGTYPTDNNYDMEATDRIKRSNLKLHCEWDNCDFFTSDISELLDHVPEHMEVTKIKKETSESDSDNEHRQHICKWINHNTGVTCDDIFTCTEDLTNHIIKEHVQSGKSSYVCNWEGCNRHEKPFTQRQKIIRHMNTHTKHKPFECEICHKRFSLDLMLKQHMRIHTGEKPYKCDMCGKTFKTSSSLTIHLRIHSGDKPMECKICGKRFNESSNLNKHMKIHFREYKCELCLKSFDSEMKFRRHQLICKRRLK